MSDTIASLQRKIQSATELHSVVRTMKAMAVASVGQFENAVISLDDYYRTVQLGLIACFRQADLGHETELSWVTPGAGVSNTERLNKTERNIGAVVFGSDQGLVGQFNEVLAEFVVTSLATIPGNKKVWAVGERLQSRLAETDLFQCSEFALPKTLKTVAPFVSEILLELETCRANGDVDEVLIFHNQPKSGSIYQPTIQRLFPLDKLWRSDLQNIPWPAVSLPEVINSSAQTLLAFIHEYLFVSLYRACAESLASENASRLASMQRAEKNIDELLEEMNTQFHVLRQSSIDEELFDVISGFEAFQTE